MIWGLLSLESDLLAVVGEGRDALSRVLVVQHSRVVVLPGTSTVLLSNSLSHR
jgi:hypothetical protein